MDSVPQKTSGHQDTLLRVLFENATVGIVMVNEKGAIIRCNPHATKMFGYETDQLIGQQVEILIPGNLHEKHLGHRKSYHENPIPRYMGIGRELFAIRKDGKQFPVEISLSYAEEDGNKVVIALVTDVTLRKEKSKELTIKSEAISSATVPICFADLEGNITYANSAFIKLWGFNKEEDVLGMSNMELGTSSEKVKEIMSVMKETGTWTGYDKAKKVDGTPFDIFLTTSLVRNGGGIPICTIATFIDMTEQKKNEALLIQKELQLLEYSDQLEQKVIARTNDLAESQAKLIEAKKVAKLGYMEYDLVENIIRGSQQLFNIFDLNSNTPITFKQFTDYIHPDDVDILNSKTKEAKEKNEFLSVEFRIITAEGNIKHVFTKTSIIIKDDEGKPIIRRGIMQDITLLKTTEIALRENQNKLEKALKAEQELGELKSRFVSMASHEFRTPLTTILSSSNLVEMHLKRGNFDRYPKHLNNIKSAVNNLTSILNDFLSLEKLESGKVNLNLKQTNLSEFIPVVLDEVNLLATKNQSIIYVQSGEDEVNIDQHLVRNILINLLSNAIKYSPNGEDTDLFIDRKKSSLFIKVKDRGIGIPEDQQELMFGRFFRASIVYTIQ
jgi:PAS domain S-box-containing protein